MINKTFVNGVFYRLKNNFIVSVFKDGSNPVGLFYAVAENKDFITFSDIFLQVVAY